MRDFFLLMMVYLMSLGICFAQQDSISSEKEITYDQQNINPVEFNEETIATYKNEPSFNYERIPQENWWTYFKTWVGKLWGQFMEWLLGSYTASGILGFLIRILPYLVAVGIFAFVVWLFVKLNPAAAVLEQKRETRVGLSDDEEILEREDIAELMKKARQAENYRLAVRYYYLLILKNMRDLKLIDYQFQKTNEEYLSEIVSVSTKEQFKNITYIYDFIWYGDFPVTETDFRKVEKDFAQILLTLNTSSHGETL